MRYLVECLGYSAFILEFHFRPLLKLRDSPLNTTSVVFYPSVNVMWINLFVFQTPDGNRFAKEISLEC